MDLPITHLIHQQLQAIWNAVIPRRAVRVEQHPQRRTHIRYLHPTKGWRNVHKQRLGRAIALMPARETANG